MKKLVFALSISMLMITGQVIAETSVDQVKGQLYLISLAMSREDFDLVSHKLDNLRNHETGHFGFDLEERKAYKVVAVCDSDCGDIDLTLYDENDNKIAEDTKTDGVPIVDVMPRWDGHYKLKVKMYNCRINPCSFGIALFKKTAHRGPNSM